jgi:hypothetical protein
MADTSAASVGRSATGRIRGALISAAIIAAVIAVPATTLAAKGHGGTSAGATPWIALASVNGAAATVHPMLGASVGFASGYPSTTKNPWVSVMCYEGSSLVYGEGGGPTHQFQLGGASSTWLGVGGTANCTAELGDLYWRGGHEYYTYLATTSFSAN